MSSLKKNILYSGILSVSQVFFPLLTLPYVANILLPSGLGKITFVENICRYLILLSALGIPIYGVREISKNKNNNREISKILVELLIIHFISTFIILIIFFISINEIHKLNENKVFYFWGFLLIFSDVFSIEWYFKGVSDFKFILIRTLIIKSAQTSSVFYFINKQTQILEYFLLIISFTVFNTLINIFIAFKNLDKSTFRRTIHIKRHLSPIFYLFATIFFVSLYNFLDIILLGFIADDTTVGIYSAGLKICRIPISFVSAVGIVLLPKLTFLNSNKNIHDYNKLVMKSINFTLITAISFIFIIYFTADKIIDTFFGIEYVKSASIIKLLSPLVLFVGLSNIFGLQILTSIGKDKYFMISVFIAVFVSIIFNLVLTPIYKEIGTCISILLSEITVTILTYYFASRFIKISIPYYLLFRLLFLFFPLYLIMNAINHIQFNSLISIILFTIISMVLIVFVNFKLLKSLIREKSI